MSPAATALTQRLSLLHRAIFWFSPLAWYLDRQLADLAEQASDEAALSYGADRKHYARILLGFFEALHATPGRVWWQGVSMAMAGHADRQAEERVERILSWKGSVAMHLKKSIAILVVALAVPLVYLAASVRAASNVSGNIVASHSMSFAHGQEATPTAPSPTPASRPNVSTSPATAPNAAGARRRLLLPKQRPHPSLKSLLQQGAPLPGMASVSPQSRRLRPWPVFLRESPIRRTHQRQPSLGRVDSHGVTAPVPVPAQAPVHPMAEAIPTRTAMTRMTISVS